MNGFAQALGRCARHLGLQLVERDSQIVRHMNSGNKLAQVFESLRGLLQVCARRQEALEFAGQFVLSVSLWETLDCCLPEPRLESWFEGWSEE